METNDKVAAQKNYKVKDLRVYNSTEYLFENRKNYRQVYDRYELTYVYAELSFYNKHFDIDSWDLDIEFKCYQKVGLENKQICHLMLNKKISKYDSIVYIREGWGSKKEGQFWRNGTYYWEAIIGGEVVGSKIFFVEDTGKKNINTENYLKVIGGKLYEGMQDDVENSLNKASFTTFALEHTRYIFFEVQCENLHLTQQWNCEMFVRYYNEAGEIKALTSKIRSVKPTEKNFSLVFGFGSNNKGSWLLGRYRMELVFMNKLVCIVPFHVDQDFLEGSPTIMVPGTEATTYLKVDAEAQKSFEDQLQEFESLIGLNEIKDKIRQHATYLQFLHLRRTHGFHDDDFKSLFLVFTGNPGTGKTTVAHKLGMLYKSMGILSKGHVLEVDRSDLVGEFIGQTAPKVKDMIEKARGGILFIDEAYSLARAMEDVKDFGREVIEILVKEMSSGVGDLAIIVAGYPKEMKTFIESNPGLKSRFKYYFEFPDYQPHELVEIAQYASKEKELKLDEEAKNKLEEIIVEEFRNRNKHFGNARFVYDLIEQAKINLGIRIMKSTHADQTPYEDLMKITLQDIETILQERKSLPLSLPIDKILLDRSIEDLDRLIGMDQIKKEIHDLVKVVKYYKKSNKNVLSMFYFHTVFVGNPGTGKTTVARILSKIYKALGILERGHIIETDRQGLVAGFIGQTALKTTEKINDAIGGVLFIDEAYALTSHSTHGDFGNEAIQTIIKRMEDERGKFFVFVAGYPENMDGFMKANPGLSSRFDKILRFEDYNAKELNEIANHIIGTEGYTLSIDAMNWVVAHCINMFEKRDRFFGNARTVRKFILEVIKQQNLRQSALTETQSTTIANNVIEVVDLNAALITPQEDSMYQRKSLGFKGS